MTAYTLNLLDLALTLYAIQRGGVELNPLMRNPYIMIAYKTVIVGALCLWLHHFAEGGNKVARLGLWAITAVYAGIIIWHLANLI